MRRALTCSYEIILFGVAERSLLRGLLEKKQQEHDGIFGPCTHSPLILNMHHRNVWILHITPCRAHVEALYRSCLSSLACRLHPSFAKCVFHILHFFFAPRFLCNSFLSHRFRFRFFNVSEKVEFYFA